MFATRFSQVVLLAALCFLPAPGNADKQTLDARVMSYNIRYDKAAPVHRAEGARAGDARQALRKLLDRPRVPLRAQATMLEAPETKLERWLFSFDSEADERVPGLLVKQTNALGRRPVVIALHGTGGNKEGQLSLLNELAERGFIAVASEKPEFLMGAVFYKHYAPLALQNLGIRKQYQNGARSILADIAHGQKSAKKFLEHYDEQLYASHCRKSDRIRDTAIASRPRDPAVQTSERWHPTAGWHG